MTRIEVLQKYFGYSSFREGQETLIDAILNGRDVLGIMSTGAGKSICYQIPALLLPGITVVISPLISLMKDQVQALNQLGIHAAYINSSLTESQIRAAMQYAIDGRYKIIYVAPERLETNDFRHFAECADISMVTVDEAHCISQWGQDFRPSYLKIADFIQRFKKRPILSTFTATATKEVREDILESLELHDPIVLVSGFDRKNLFFGVETPVNKMRYLLNYVEEHIEDSGIIYCATRKNVEKVYEQLLSEGIAVTRYHAGLSAEERNENQEDFIYDLKPVAVATNAFGMGIDKSNVRYVIHYNMPQSMENYYQEAGRAGRDGAPAECILLYSPQDVMIDQFLIEQKEQNSELNFEENQLVRERDLLRLHQMTRYCRTTHCLRQYILEYFGEQTVESCENCSNCQKEFEEIDYTEAAKDIITCIFELGQRFGVNVITGTLHGDKRAKLLEYHVDKSSVYGVQSSLSEFTLKQIINEMMERGYLKATNDKYSIIKICKKAYDLKDGADTLVLRQSKEQEADISEMKDSKKTTGRYGSSKVAGSKSGHKKKSRTAKTVVLSEQNEELFEQLRLLRMELARIEKVPPYIIFSDKTLIDMCEKRPETKEQMLEVSGVGEQKFTKYGKQFIEKISSSSSR